MTELFLMEQWIRICLPIQGAWFQSLIQEESTCHRATKPCATTTEAHMPKACAPQQEKPLQKEACALQLRQPMLTATRESPHKATRTQCSLEKQNNKN